MTKTVGLFQPFPPAPLTDAPGLRAAILRARHNKANPRSGEYMRTLFAEFFPEGEFVTAGDDDNWQAKTRAADRLVLLFPDATGLETRSIRRVACENKEDGQHILVLNGRRRLFLWSREIRAHLAVRRLLENFLIGEIVFAAMFAILTPVFLMVDFVRGRV